VAAIAPVIFEAKEGKREVPVEGKRGVPVGTSTAI
jgi:hypothetical protein